MQNHTVVPFAALKPGDVFLIADERPFKLWVVLPESMPYNPTDTKPTHWVSQYRPETVWLERNLPKHRHLPPATNVVKVGDIHVRSE